MKRILLTGMLFLGLGANAQLPNGSVAPDFTLTDIDGVSHNLYTYLNAGKTVFIDISATWCGPCWNYHNTDKLEDLWVEHGPTGGTNVSGSTTNDVIVLFIEGDGSTTSADLDGSGTNTQGDWVTGVSHPIIDPATSAINTFNNNYEIGYFPTLYKICPNRIITEASTSSSVATLYSSISSCDATTSSADVLALPYTGKMNHCKLATYSPSVSIYNNSTTALTSATVTITQNGTTVSTGTYSGSLASFGSSTVTCTPILNFDSSLGSLVFVVTTSGDVDVANGTFTKTIVSSVETTNRILLDLKTDFFASETSWKIKDNLGATVAGTTNPTLANDTQYSQIYNLTALGCYAFNIYDDYGDGILNGTAGSTTHNGMINVRDNLGAVIINDIDFGSGGDILFKVTSIISTLGINEIGSSAFMVYPNPATDKLNVTFDAENTDYVISITDISGRVLTSNNYSNLSGSQNIELSLAEVASGNYIVTVSNNSGTTNKHITIK